jgi:transcriptional regulator
MKKYIGLFFVCFTSLLILVSCKSKAVAVTDKTNEDLSAEKVIENLYKNKKDFSTLYIKANVLYENEKQTQKVTAEIKIKKDEMISVSIRFLGITMAKALITPKQVKYYEKIGSSYFEGDYSALSKWLGTDLDFQKAQNIFVGQALEDLTKGKYTVVIEENSYKLESVSDMNTSKTVFVEGEKFRITKQELYQKAQERALQVQYPNYMEYNQIALPSRMIIQAIQKKDKTNINIDYNTVTFNEELSFPYSVPNGYEQIFIN